MEDIITDFYKRFLHDGGKADMVSCPASVCLFGSGSSSCPEVGLKLSFGAEAAYRRRSDDRIVLSRTDSDTLQSVNIIDLYKFNGADWAREILSATEKLPIKPSGAEILLHTDVGAPELAPRLLCAIYAAATLFGNSVTTQAVLRAASYPAYYMASLLKEERVSVANTSTLDYLAYKLPIKEKKIIVVKIESQRKRPKFSSAFSERENDRIKKAALCLNDGYTDSVGQLMCEASRDMLKIHPDSKAELLFNNILDFTGAVRILPDYSGAVAFVADDSVDEFVKLVGDKHEKKTGTRPAFYISN